MHSLPVKLWLGAITLFFGLLTSSAVSAGVNDDVNMLRQEWAVAKFQTPRKQQIPVFQTLIQKAERVSAKYPNNARVMVWHATILSTYASIKGGMGVLKHVKKARNLLEKAIRINPRIENGFAHGVLGALYARVPGWPVAFGSDKKAEQYLKTAIRLDPNGSDSNYYYGDFLVEQGDKQAGIMHLEKARKAPIRRGYEVHDRGRKGEIARSLHKAR